MIKFKCASCDKAYQLPDNAAGRKARCKSCGEAMVVPDAPDDLFDDSASAGDDLTSLYSSADSAEPIEHAAAGDEPLAFNPDIGFKHDPKQHKSAGLPRIYVLAGGGGAFALILIVVVIAIVMSGGDKDEDGKAAALAFDPSVDTSDSGILNRPRTTSGGDTGEVFNGQAEEQSVLEDVVTPIIAHLSSFKPTELPRGAEQVMPDPEEQWPAFGPPPGVDVSNWEEVDFYGCRVNVLPGYVLDSMKNARDGGHGAVFTPPQVYDNTTTRRTLPKRITFSISPVELHKLDGEIPKNLTEVLKANRIDPTKDSIQYGEIDGIRFARYEKRDQGILAAVYYYAMLPDAVIRIHFTLGAPGLSMHPEQQLKELLMMEAMARSLRVNRPAEETPFVLVPDEADKGLIVEDPPPGLEESRFRILHNYFYALKDPPIVFHKAAKRDGYDLVLPGIAFGTKDRIFPEGGMFIHAPIEGQSQELRVSPNAHKFTRPDDGFNGRTVHAFGGEVDFMRLWDDQVFVRVFQDVSSVHQQVKKRKVAYYGWLGTCWVEIAYEAPAAEFPESLITAFDHYIRSMRLIHPSSLWIVKGETNYRDSAEAILRSIIEDETIDLPLANGLMLSECIEKDAYGRLVYTAKSGVTRDLPEPMPILDPLEHDEALDAFEVWDVAEEAGKHLVNSHQVGQIELRPLIGMKRSESVKDPDAEWYSQTRDGRVAMNIRHDPSSDAEPPRTIPFERDEEADKTILFLGTQKLRVSQPPEVQYREVNGLRVWRLLMPRVQGGKLRRCYYLVNIPGYTVVVTADFQATELEQLDAFDAAVSTIKFNGGTSEYERDRQQRELWRSEGERVKELMPK